MTFDIRIKKVANGYVVIPSEEVRGQQIHVFETFDSLVVYLKEKIGSPEGKNWE